MLISFSSECLKNVVKGYGAPVVKTRTAKNRHVHVHVTKPRVMQIRVVAVVEMWMIYYITCVTYVKNFFIIRKVNNVC